MMVPATMDNFVQTLLRDRRVELQSSILVSDNARVFADAVPKAVSFDLNCLDNEDQLRQHSDHSQHRRSRWGGSAKSGNGNSSSNNNNDACSCDCLPMPKRKMSPYPKPTKLTSPGSLTRTMILQNLSDHLCNLRCSDDEISDDMDSSTHLKPPVRKECHHHHSQQQLRLPMRSPEPMDFHDSGLSFDMHLEMSPEFSRPGDEDDSSVSTDCSDF